MDGRTIAQLREYQGLTQKEVARAAGVQQSIVSDVERGVRDSPEQRAQVVRGLRRSMTPSRALSLHGATMRDLLERHGASDIRVFGSAATGSDRWDSDIDLVARFDRPMSLLDIGRLTARLRRIAGGLRVDLVAETDRTRLRDVHEVPL